MKGDAVTRTLPYLSAALLTVLCGVAHGLRTDRWVVSKDLQDAAARLDKVPTTFGDWLGRDETIDRRQMEAAGIVGHLMRRYEDRRNGAVVSMLLVCGRPGPISVHTPDICYAGAGFTMADDPARLPLTCGAPPHPAEAIWADFVKEKASSATRLRIYWTWSTGGPWRAPENPRLAHAAHRALYKLYVIHETNGPAGPVGDDPGLAFLRAAVPELERALTPAPASR